MILGHTKINWSVNLNIKRFACSLVFFPKMKCQAHIHCFGSFQEAESRILKALQPDLCLNPEPLHYRQISGEPVIKKVISCCCTLSYRKFQIV